MVIEVSYARAKADLASLLDEVSLNNNVAVIHRRGKEDVALVRARELAGLEETVHLLSSPRNAERLLSALRGARERTHQPMTLDELKALVGL